MRIIAGTYRGRNLSTARDRSIRPTTDRAKQTIFDILSNRIEFDGCSVLDLFSGSGSLGLEAISRGAGHVTFVDKSRSSLTVLEANIRALNCGDRCTIHHADVLWYLNHARQSFDLIFIDPPYDLEQIGSLPSLAFESGVLRAKSFVVMEHSKESIIDISDKNYTFIRKLFGQTVVLILQPIFPSLSSEAQSKELL